MKDLRIDLLYKLVPLADNNVRLAYAESQIAELPGTELLMLLHEALFAVRQAADLREPLLLLTIALRTRFSEAQRLQLQQLALNSELEEVAMLFVEEPSAEEHSDRRVPDFGSARPLTLGERKSLARQHDRNLIKRVLHDPAADVIRIVLDNPSLLEDDVVKLAARRPLVKEIFDEIFVHLRWIVRYRIKCAVAFNPYTPVGMAASLLPQLKQQDRKRLSEISGLSPKLLQMARAIDEDFRMQSPG